MWTENLTAVTRQVCHGWMDQTTGEKPQNAEVVAKLRQILAITMLHTQTLKLAILGLQSRITQIQTQRLHQLPPKSAATMTARTVNQDGVV